MRQTVAAAAAFLAAFFVSPAHANDNQAAASYVCISEPAIMELAALDERKGRTIEDMVGLMQAQLRGYQCFALSPQPFRLVSLIYAYTDADGVQSEVWQGLLPQATRVTFTIIMARDEASDA